MIYILRSNDLWHIEQYLVYSLSAYGKVFQLSNNDQPLKHQILHSLHCFNHIIAVGK